MAAQPSALNAPFEYIFPSIRGIQAKRIFSNEEALVPELRAPRLPNKGCALETARYLVGNCDSYTFSAITASIYGEGRFDPLGGSAEARRVGLLHIPVSARFIINDGQHRHAAVEHTIRETPELAGESIAIVFFLDVGLERCQQVCADLNRHAVPPSTSTSVLYDHRDDGARLTKLALLKLPQRIKNIALSDWTRGNAKLWEGRALVGGKVSEATTNVVLTSNALKERLGFGLTPEEQRAEDVFRRRHPGTN